MCVCVCGCVCNNVTDSKHCQNRYLTDSSHNVTDSKHCQNRYLTDSSHNILTLNIVSMGGGGGGGTVVPVFHSHDCRKLSRWLTTTPRGRGNTAISFSLFHHTLLCDITNRTNQSTAVGMHLPEQKTTLQYMFGSEPLCKCGVWPAQASFLFSWVSNTGLVRNTNKQQHTNRPLNTAIFRERERGCLRKYYRCPRMKFLAGGGGGGGRGGTNRQPTATTVSPERPY